MLKRQVSEFRQTRIRTHSLQAWSHSLVTQHGFNVLDLKKNLKSEVYVDVFVDKLFCSSQIGNSEWQTACVLIGGAAGNNRKL